MKRRRRRAQREFREWGSCGKAGQPASGGLPSFAEAPAPAAGDPAPARATVATRMHAASMTPGRPQSLTLAPRSSAPPRETYAFATRTRAPQASHAALTPDDTSHCCAGLRKALRLSGRQPFQCKGVGIARTHPAWVVVQLRRRLTCKYRRSQARAQRSEALWPRYRSKA